MIEGLSFNEKFITNDTRDLPITGENLKLPCPFGTCDWEMDDKLTSYNHHCHTSLRKLKRNNEK